MSKIICDICGTSYPETAKQCPICGCVRPGDVQRVTNEIKSNGKVSTGYTYVKGGRFSKSNVKKRTKAVAAASGSKKSTPKSEKANEGGSSRGLAITAVILLLAIIGVIIYIAVHFIGPLSNPNVDPTTNTTPTGQIDLTCKGLTIDTNSIVFDHAGAARLLVIKVQPENTTDIVTYRSENTAIATVNDVGKITAVAEGTTKIIITCGEVVEECQVICEFVEAPTNPTTAPTEPTEPTNPTEPTKPTEPTQSTETIRLNRKDITFSYKGESWVLYSGSVAKNLITWSSDDESVVTFVDGKAVAVGSGMTEVHAEYNGQKVSCIIRCNFKEENGVTGNGGVSEDGGGVGGNGGVSEDGGNSSGNGGTTEDGDNTTPTTGNYKVYTQWGNAVEDVTIHVGEAVALLLKDESGNVVNVSWNVSSDACTVSGGVITGAKSGTMCTVSATHEGSTYSCIIRVIK